ncbi:hypothetical protein FOVSG1_009396 [Fusarium oxysporum f. sp. vasinfectum]
MRLNTFRCCACTNTPHAISSYTELRAVSCNTNFLPIHHTEQGYTSPDDIGPTSYLLTPYQTSRHLPVRVLSKCWLPRRVDHFRIIPSRSSWSHRTTSSPA